MEKKQSKYKDQKQKSKKNTSILDKSIYKPQKKSYILYKSNSNEIKISNEQQEKYIAVLKIGIIKELMQQKIITADEMAIIVKQIKNQNKLEVEIEQ